MRNCPRSRRSSKPPPAKPTGRILIAKPRPFGPRFLFFPGKGRNSGASQFSALCRAAALRQVGASFAFGLMPRSSLRLGWIATSASESKNVGLPAHAATMGGRRWQGGFDQMPRGLPRGSLLSGPAARRRAAAQQRPIRGIGRKLRCVREIWVRKYRLVMRGKIVIFVGPPAKNCMLSLAPCGFTPGLTTGRFFWPKRGEPHHSNIISCPRLLESRASLRGMMRRCEFLQPRGILLEFSAAIAIFNLPLSHISALSTSVDARFFPSRIGAKSRISRTSLLFAKKFLPSFRRKVASHLFSLIFSL